MLSTVQGVIRRRVLVNYRVDPQVAARLLPAPFRPKLLGDAALAGICLIRLEQVRPRGVPAPFGWSSENAAHRIAVRWTDAGGEREGVYIPRRDTGSLIIGWTGGRLFPGEHHRASFQVRDRDDAVDLSMRSRDGAVVVSVRGRTAAALPPTSRFGSLQEASAFFQAGALGYSETAARDRLEGLCLVTTMWRVEPLDVEQAHSTFFDDRSLFPPGSVRFDCALVMRNIVHQWRRAPDLPRRANGDGREAGRPAMRWAAR